MQLSTDLETDDANSQRTILGLTKTVYSQYLRRGKTLISEWVVKTRHHLGRSFDLVHAVWDVYHTRAIICAALYVGHIMCHMVCEHPY